MTPPQLVHLAHGSPRVEGCGAASGRCYVCCGIVERGKLVADWLSTNFTDQNRCRSPLSTHVCEACCYVQSRTSPVLGRDAKEGKKFGGNFRNYSHFLEDGQGYANASKGEKPLIRAFLARDHAAPWFCGIADSGQKHVLPFTPLNGRGRAGLVLFEEALVNVPDDQSLIGDMTTMLTAGVTKDEIESGNYYVRTMRDTRETVQSFEREHGARRGGDWFRLAIWLAQRDEEEFQRQDAAKKEATNARRKTAKATGDAGSRDALGDPKRVPKRVRRKAGAGLLDATPEPVQSGGAANHDGQRVDGSGSAQDASPGPAQLGLPGLG